MSPNEVIDQLSKIGIDISRATLLRYENQELIPKPSRGGGGAGGRWTDYPDDTVLWAEIAWRLIHGEYGGTEIRKYFEGKMLKLPPLLIAKLRSKQIKCMEKGIPIQESWDDAPSLGGEGLYLCSFQIIYDSLCGQIKLGRDKKVENELQQIERGLGRLKEKMLR